MFQTTFNLDVKTNWKPEWGIINISPEMVWLNKSRVSSRMKEIYLCKLVSTKLIVPMVKHDHARLKRRFSAKLCPRIFRISTARDIE